MLDRLAETFIAGVELLEAEGKVAADKAAGLASATVLLLICGAAGLLGLLAAIVGSTWLLAEALGMGAALAMMGTLVATASTLGGLVVRRRLRGVSDPLDDAREDSIVYPPEYPE